MTSPEPPSGGSPDRTPETGAFVRAFASALQKWMMYPEGHESLEPALDALVEAAGDALADRDEVELRLSEGRLRVQGSPVDRENPVLAGLARRLHDEQLRSLAFRSGLTRTEMAEVLTLLSDSASSEEPLGERAAEELPDGPHLSVEPFRYERMQMDDRPDDLSAERRPDGRSEEALVEEDAGEIAARLSDSLAGPGPESAEAVDELVGLLEATGEEGGEQLEDLRRKMSAVILQLEPEVLARLTEQARQNGDEARLLRAAADGFDLEAVRRLVKAAAARREEGIADWLLRLLAKLSQYGPSDDPDADTPHREDVRETVERIIENWDLEDPRPQTYTDQLDDLTRRRPGDGDGGERRTLEVEPDRMVAMGLEMDEPAPPIREASEEMVDAERFSELSSFLRRSPGDSEVGQLLWSQLSVPRVVRKLLDAGTGQRELLDRIVVRSGVDVAPALLDALSEPEARERTFRDRVIDLLCRIGEPVASLVPDRLDSPEPFARRNLLRLLTALAVLPPNFSPLAHLEDPDAGVRLKAFQIAAEREEDRPEAIRRGLEDDHLKLVSLALQEAEASFPPSAEETVIGHLRDESLPESVRIHAVRALGGHGSDAALEALVDLVWVKRWYFWRRLAPPSPLVLEALGTMSRRWPDHPLASGPLEAARSSDDPDVRSAVSGEGGGER